MLTSQWSIIAAIIVRLTPRRAFRRSGGIKTARTRLFSVAAMNYSSRRSVFGRNRVVSLRVIEKSCAQTAAREFCQIRQKATKGIRLYVTANVGHIQTHAESSVLLFARPANLSGADSDKSRQENVWQTSGYSRGRIRWVSLETWSSPILLERDEWILRKVRHHHR